MSSSSSTVRFLFHNGLNRHSEATEACDLPYSLHTYANDSCRPVGIGTSANPTLLTHSYRRHGPYCYNNTHLLHAVPCPSSRPCTCRRKRLEDTRRNFPGRLFFDGNLSSNQSSARTLPGSGQTGFLSCA